MADAREIVLIAAGAVTLAGLLTTVYLWWDVRKEVPTARRRIAAGDRDGRHLLRQALHDVRVERTRIIKHAGLGAVLIYMLYFGSAVFPQAGVGAVSALITLTSYWGVRHRCDLRDELLRDGIAARSRLAFRGPPPAP